MRNARSVMSKTITKGPVQKTATTGHDFAARAAIGGFQTRSFDKEGHFYVTKVPTGESVTYPVGHLSRGTRLNLLSIFLKLGIPAFIIFAVLRVTGVIPSF